VPGRRGKVIRLFIMLIVSSFDLSGDFQVGEGRRSLSLFEVVLVYSES